MTAQYLGDPMLGLSVLRVIDAAGAPSWPEPLSLFEHYLQSAAMHATEQA